MLLKNVVVSLCFTKNKSTKMKKQFLPFVSTDTKVEILDTDIEIKKVLVTPALALELLKGNVCNRSLRKSKINKYAADMNNNLWHADTSETIKIAKNRRLLDGQNRLNAIIQIGKPVASFIAYPVPESAMNNIDTGMTRSTKNIFELNGIANAQQVSSAIKKYLAYKMHPSLPDNDPIRKGGVTDIMVLDEYFSRSEEWQEIVSKLFKCKNTFKNIECTFLMAWYALCKEINKEHTEHYFNTLLSGVGFTTDKDPIYLFREYLLKNNTEKSIEQKRIITFALFIKSWNYTRTKQAISNLRFTSNEKYPKLK